MVTNESIGCFRVFEMDDGGEMTPLIQPRMTAAECFAWIAEVEGFWIAEVERFEGAAKQVAPMGVYRRVEGGWEEVLAP